MRKSHGRMLARRSGSGKSHTHAGSSWKARASTSLASRSRARSSLTTSTMRTQLGGAELSSGVSALRSLDLHDLELEGAAGSLDLDDLALLLPHDRLADGRLVGELVLGGIGLRGADDVVLERLVRLHVAQADARADRDGVLGDLLLRDHPCGQEPLLELRDLVLEHRLLVLRVVVLRVLGDVAELTGDADALGDLAALLAAQVVDLLLELPEPLRCEDDFLQERPPDPVRNGREW